MPSFGLHTPRDDDDYDTRDFALASQFGTATDPALPAGVQAAVSLVHTHAEVGGVY